LLWAVQRSSSLRESGADRSRGPHLGRRDHDTRLVPIVQFCFHAEPVPTKNAVRLVTIEVEWRNETTMDTMIEPIPRVRVQRGSTRGLRASKWSVLFSFRLFSRHTIALGVSVPLCVVCCGDSFNSTELCGLGGAGRRLCWRQRGRRCLNGHGSGVITSPGCRPSSSTAVRCYIAKNHGVFSAGRVAFSQRTLGQGNTIYGQRSSGCAPYAGYFVRGRCADYAATISARSVVLEGREA
jgi:hypothetical protein